MASLNTSANGPAIKNSYQKVVDASPPSGAAASSPTYGQWAVFTVQAPLANAFQNDSTKESLLKVQTTGEGELVDLIEEFSDGRIQFAFVKVKDSNSGLPKSVLIAWCGEGVPERTKGYFTSHLTAVSKLLHGYHVQITARSDRDLTPESIIQKVADASGAKYTGGPSPNDSASRAPPPTASKPVFLPSKVGGGVFTPLGSRSRAAAPSGNTDLDGWGEDAPQVSRSQLEKVESAYRPTKVNISELTSQRQEPSRFIPPTATNGSDVVKGGYQPIGKVDLDAIRREAKEKGTIQDDRPTIVKGAYEPIGKVDIAAIRAKAQGAPPPSTPSAQAQDEDERPKSLAERSTAFQQQERLTSLPKPKVANKFAGSTSAFTGTERPSMGGVPNTTNATAAPVGVASRSFADQGGKTPAQLWAEKKAKEGGSSFGATSSTPQTAAVAPQKSGGWQSGYTGKKWDSVQTTKTGTSNISTESQEERGLDQEEEQDSAASGGFAAAASRFDQPPPLNASSKPNAGGGIALPGLPTRGPSLAGHPAEERVDLPTPPPQPRSPSPEPSSSPVRIAMPVSRTAAPQPLVPADEEETIPTAPLAKIASSAPEPPAEEEDEDPARNAGQAVAESSFGAAAASANPGAAVGGKRALVQYDYEKAEDNEIELVEGQYVTDIEMVDDDWWMGRNSKGETGLFPSNYVELVEDGGDAGGPSASAAREEPVPAPPPVETAPPAGPAGGAQGNPTATAQFEYEAAEDNEISFPEGAKITDVEFPDDDWWLGVYNGKQGLFPANYVQLDE